MGLDHLRRDASIGYKISFRLHTHPVLQSTSICLESRPDGKMTSTIKTPSSRTCSVTKWSSRRGQIRTSLLLPLLMIWRFPLFHHNCDSHDMVAGVQALQALTVGGPADRDGSQAANLPIWGGASLHAQELNCQAMIMQCQQNRAGPE